MEKLRAVIGSAIFLVIAPGTIAGLVPYLITDWHVGPPLFGLAVFRAAGIGLIVAGIPGLLDSFARFALQGVGTPAPPLPTRHLVVTGLYRYVRNPMYVAVVSIVLGEGLLFGSVTTLMYGILVWTAMHLFVLVYEEPTLREKYGSRYYLFTANVPRWIPRLRPWRGSGLS